MKTSIGRIVSLLLAITALLAACWYVWLNYQQSVRENLALASLRTSGVVQSTTNSILPDWVPFSDQSLFQRVTELRLSGDGFSDSSLVALREFGELRSFALFSNSTQISDKGLNHLPITQKLVAFSVDGSHIGGPLLQVGDATLRRVAAGRSLEVVSMECTSVTDAGVCYLKGHPGITHLRLGGTQITRQIINCLCSLRSLEYLDLEATQLTSDDSKKLKNCLPNIRTILY